MRQIVLMNKFIHAIKIDTSHQVLHERHSNTKNYKKNCTGQKQKGCQTNKSSQMNHTINQNQNAKTHSTILKLNFHIQSKIKIQIITKF